MSKRRYLFLGLLPFLALIVSSLPLFPLEFPQGNDWIFELVRVAEFKSAIVNGQFPPYWGENLYGGYGSPVYLFYAPLYLSVSTFCSILTGSIAGGSTLALIIFSLVGVLSVKLVLQAALGKKTFENEAASRISIYFFILNPYLICDKLLRNANAEYAALCVFPLAIYGILIIGRKPRIGGLILAAGLALTITAHNLTALITAALISTAALVLYLPGKRVSLWITIIGSMALGLGLSAFFWLPAVYYKSFVRSDELMTGRFDFHTQYQPLISFFGYDQIFSAGLVTPLVLLCAIGIFWVARGRKELAYKKLNIFAFGSSLFFLFLQTRASVYIWEKVPYMPFFQFPWRMMGPLALVSSIVAGLSFAYLYSEKSKHSITFREIIFLFLCILNALPHLKASEPLPEGVLSQLSYILRGETIKNKGLSVTVGDEFLPRFACPDVWRTERSHNGPVVHSIPKIDMKVVKDSGTNITLETSSDSPARLQLARWFFPGWKCTVNGELRDVEINKLGSFDISIPAGFNQIILQLGPPLLRRVSSWVSLASLTVWCIIMLISTIRHCRSRRST
jgi:hypothetical protein